MKLQPPGIPPIIVHWLTPEKMFYQEGDFWLSVVTLLLVAMTFWLALETRGLRQDSAKAIKASEDGIAIARDSAHRTLRALPMSPSRRLSRA